VVLLQSVRRHYRVSGETIRAVDGVDLAIAAGERVAVMGPSGSGKSTLLSVVSGIELPTDGVVRVLGTDLDAASDDERVRLRRRGIGLLFQDSTLLSFLTVTENVALAVGLAADERLEDVGGLLAAVGLAAHADRFPDELSGGERQRVAIARCLASRPALVIGDEPTGSLDSVTSQLVMRAFLQTVRDRGSATLVATHDPDVAALFDRVLLLRDGVIVDEVEPRSLHARLTDAALRAE
jgi:putative ABC transport system ATP-binding protein